MATLAILGVGTFLVERLGTYPGGERTSVAIRVPEHLMCHNFTGSVCNLRLGSRVSMYVVTDWTAAVIRARDEVVYRVQFELAKRGTFQTPPKPAVPIGPHDIIVSDWEGQALEGDIEIGEVSINA